MSAPPAAGAPASGQRRVSPYAPAQEDPNTRGHYTAGGLYRPGVPDSLPDYLPNVDLIPEPEVVDLPRSPVGNRSPYQVLGKTYHVLDDHSEFTETGTASYYGAKFHGRLTSNREVYDMYAFTAAHKSLPLPSFARVTNLDTGQSVVVRVNDRGPFHEGRVVDLSYAAAVKIGIHPAGTGRVEVRALSPGENARQTWDAVAGAPAPAAAAPVAATSRRGRAAGTPAAPAATTAAVTPAGSAIDAIVEALPIASARADGEASSTITSTPGSLPNSATSEGVNAACSALRSSSRRTSSRDTTGAGWRSRSYRPASMRSIISNCFSSSST